MRTRLGSAGVRSLLLAVVPLTLACACTATVTTTESSDTVRVPVPETTAAVETTPADPTAMCQAAAHTGTLAQWSAGTVEDFRSWQHGGPRPHRPLANAFPGLPQSTRGAWCGYTSKPDLLDWYAVVPGQAPAMLISIGSPGQAIETGPVPGGPVVP